MNKLILTLSLFSACTISVLQAASSSISLKSLNSSSSQGEGSSEPESGYLDFFGDNWNSSISILTEDDINQNHQTTYPSNWLHLNVAKKSISDEREAVLDVTSKVSIDSERKVNFSLAQAYYQSNSQDYGKFAYGRKLVKWNELEKYWSLGHTNGVQGFSLIDEKREGLIGFHHEYGNRNKGFAVNTFFSYFYVPTLNPGLQIENGEVTSKDRWSRLPPKNTEIQGEIVPISYEMSNIDYAKILLNKSIGIDIGYAWDKGRVNAFSAYKPETNIRVNAEGYYDQDEEVVKVKANPTVNHHLVLGATVKQRLGDIEISGGADVADPNAKIGKDFEVLDPLELEQEKKIFESRYLTIRPNYARESYAFGKLALIQEKYLLSFNYIHNLLGTQRASDDFFSDTNKWDRAVGVKLQYKVSEKFNYLTDYKYDFGRKDSIIKLEGIYKIRKQMSFLLGLEVIDSPDKNSYWSFYRENDLIYSAFSYNW